jgi:hypothetical protein
MVDKKYLLTSVQMANFVADGLIRFNELIPQEINEEVMRELDEKTLSRGYMRQGQPLEETWTDSQGIGAMIRLPPVQGIIQSLVGPDPLYDHHAAHQVPAGHVDGQVWHADAIIDTRMHFDIQLFYFPHDTPREMGGTMFLPGSQYRRIHESDIARYQNFLGQLPVVCKAGTLFAGHHGIWHCAQPNTTDRLRYMFKLRLNPTVRQLRLWNTDDLDSPDIPGILFRHHRWYGNEDRLEYVNRIKFWRFLIGDDRFDAHYWLTRVENKPERIPVGVG